MHSISRYIVSASLLLSFGGCSGSGDDGGPNRVPAKGTVTYKGQPVEGARVVFSPVAPGEHAATATTGSGGEFRVGTLESADGAVPGKYNVGISKTETTSEVIPEDDPRYGNVTPKTTVTEHLPAKYKNPAKSGLTAEIKDGEENVLPPFELKD